MIDEPKIGAHWSFASLWNQALSTYGERPLQKREHMYASELGGSMIDRFYKMNAVKYTNPPNERSKRKFQAGNIWEWIVEYVLRRAGILHQKQVRAETQLSGCLRVSGKMDFIAGGTPNWQRAREDVADLGLPEFIYFATKQIVNHFETEYENKTLLELPFECKAISTFAMNRIRATAKAFPNNRIQLFHYVFGSNGQYDEGKVSYVCKDDCIIEEFPVYNDQETFELYKQDIQAMSYFFQSKIVPPKEEEIVFDDGTFRFNTNFRIEYSYYLTKIYKYKDSTEYLEKIKALIDNWNRTFNRCVTSEKMTPLNLNTIKIAKKYFPNWDDLVDRAKAAKVD